MIAKSPSGDRGESRGAAKTLAELVALDKAQPGKLAAANEGPKTFSGMISLLLNKSAGTQLLQVPYNGVSPAIQDTIAGRTQVVLVRLGRAAAFPQARRPAPARRQRGQSACAAWKTCPRSPSRTRVSNTWAGSRCWRPTGTPAVAIQRTNRDMDRGLTDPEVAQRSFRLGARQRRAPARRIR
jgi:tripartite-type tricarboxylate transporter receptor subunit TctC